MALNNLGMGIIFTATDSASSVIGQISRGFTGLDRTVKGAAEGMAKKLGVSTESMVGSLKRIAGGLVAVAAGAKIASIGVAGLQSLIGNIEDAAELESALNKIAQKGGIATSQLVELRTSLRGLTTELPLSTKGLADIATAAAQIGIKGVEDLSRFSLSIAKLAKISEFTGEQAAIVMGRLRKAFKLPVEDVDRLSSVLIGLGDSMATNAVQISDVVKRFAPFAGAIGVTAAEAAAFAATLAAAGVQTQLAGTGLNRLFATATKNIGGFAKIAGVSEDAFRRAFGKSPAKTMAFFLSRLREVDKLDMPRVLSKIGLGGSRNVQVMSVLTDQFGELNKALGESNRLFADGEEANRKFAIKMEELNAKVEVLEGNLGSIAEIIGETLKPAATAFVEVANDLLGAFIDLPPMVKKFLVVGATAGSVLLVIVGALIAVAGAAVVGVLVWTKFGVAITAAAGTALAAVTGFATAAGLAGGPFIVAGLAMLAILGLLIVAWKENVFGIQALGDAAKRTGGFFGELFDVFAKIGSGIFDIIFAAVTGDFETLIIGIRRVINGLVDFLNNILIQRAVEVAVVLGSTDLALKLDNLKIQRFAEGEVDFSLSGDAGRVIAEKSADAVTSAEARTGKVEGALSIPSAGGGAGGLDAQSLTRADLIAILDAFERRQEASGLNGAKVVLEGRTVGEVLQEQAEEAGGRRGRLSLANRR